MGPPRRCAGPNAKTARGSRRPVNTAGAGHSGSLALRIQARAPGPGSLCGLRGGVSRVPARSWLSDAPVFAGATFSLPVHRSADFGPLPLSAVVNDARDPRVHARGFRVSGSGSAVPGSRAGPAVTPARRPERRWDCSLHRSGRRQPAKAPCVPDLAGIGHFLFCPPEIPPHPTEQPRADASLPF